MAVPALPNNYMKYSVHYIGEWKPDPIGLGEPTFQKGWTREVNDLDDLEIFHRHYFAQMAKDNESVLHIGVFVYQIQHL